MMNKEQAVTYLRFSGFGDEQIKAIEGAFSCDKCVYSTSEGCQYDDITETIPPFETSDDAIRRQAVLDAINTDFHEDLSQLEDAIKALPVVEPKTGWIPVSKRLPEINKEVIVTDNETSDTYQSRYIGKGFWECDNGTFNNRIIAWMPKPKPYKAEGSDKE